jgi:hypothetical protein
MSQLFYCYKMKTAVKHSSIFFLITLSLGFDFQECEIADRAIRSELLSMERLLVHTIYVRTKNRLTDLKQELQTLLKHVEREFYYPDFSLDI